LKFKIFGKVFEVKNETAVGSGYAAFVDYLGGRGHHVSSKTALRVSAVIRCVDVVAKTMASLPVHLYQERKDGGGDKAKQHQLYTLLHMMPNPETTAYEFWHMYIFNLMLTTGAYAKIERDRNGFIRALWNIPSGSVMLRRNKLSGERYLDVTDGINGERLHEGEFMYTPGLRFGDATDPEDPIRIAADVLGLSMALNSYAKDFFEAGTNLGGFVEYDKAVSDKSYQRFKESWNKTYVGVSKQHKWAFLEDGFKLHQLGRNPKESQAIESRKFEVTEICRIFGVPPHKVFDLDRATFSNIEQQNIEFVQESIGPMAVRLEQTIYKDLLIELEQKSYYAKFSVNGLLRGDIAARTTYYHNMRQDGVFSANDIRKLEDLNPLPKDQGGDVYAVNGNMIPLTSVKDNLPKGAQKGATTNAGK
jgi:HK97 family phage portal protein